MKDLLDQAYHIAQKQDLKVLLDRLKTYDYHVNNIEFKEEYNLESIRFLLKSHIKYTIGRSSCDLENFIRHFR